MPNPNVGLGAVPANAALPIFRSADIYNYCPKSWEVLGIPTSHVAEYVVNATGVPTCNCTNSTPPKCTVTNLLKKCPAEIKNCVCVQNCDTPTTCNATNCTSGAWTAHGTGYETRNYRHCSDSSTCSSSTQYQCAAGYWGSSVNGTSGCSKCAVPGTSPAGTTTQTGCYVTSGSDTSGQYNYTDKCYYN